MIKDYAYNATPNEPIEAGEMFSQKLVSSTDEEQQNELMIYPNPASSQLEIEGITESGIVKVYDLAGKLLLQEKISKEENQLQVSSIQPGNYILQIVTPSSVISKKIIIQHW